MISQGTLPPPAPDFPGVWYSSSDGERKYTFSRGPNRKPYRAPFGDPGELMRTRIFTPEKCIFTAVKITCNSQSRCSPDCVDQTGWARFFLIGGPPGNMLYNALFHRNNRFKALLWKPSQSLSHSRSPFRSVNTTPSFQGLLQPH